MNRKESATRFYYMGNILIVKFSETHCYVLVIIKMNPYPIHFHIHMKVLMHLYVVCAICNMKNDAVIVSSVAMDDVYAIFIISARHLNFECMSQH